MIWFCILRQTTLWQRVIFRRSILVCVCLCIEMNVLLVYFTEICTRFFKGILEVSNSKSNNFGYDEELLAVILSKFVVTVLDRLTELRTLKMEIK